MSDVDREQSAATKLQKELEQVRRALLDKAETHRQQIAERQQQFEDLRQRNGELEGTVTELRLQFERSQRELHELHSRHAQPKALKSAKSRKPSKVTASAQDMSR